MARSLSSPQRWKGNVALTEYPLPTSTHLKPSCLLTSLGNSALCMIVLQRGDSTADEATERSQAADVVGEMSDEREYLNYESGESKSPPGRDNRPIKHS